MACHPMGQPSGARQARPRIRPHPGLVGQFVPAMPDCYCCWVSGHYSSPMGPGQGGIHDALLFMTGGISELRGYLLANMTTGAQVSASSGPGDADRLLRAGCRTGRDRPQSSGVRAQCATLNSCVSPGCSLPSRADCPVAGAAAPRDPGGASISRGAAVGSKAGRGPIRTSPCI